MTNKIFDGPRGAIRAEVHLNWDDPWGSALSNLGGIADVLTDAGHGDRVPADAGYSPGPFGPDVDEYPAAVFADLLHAGQTDADALAYWARVLNRYADIVPDDRRY